ncbi:MAG TPA: CdaR family protein [Candidatus Binataceae bacterium]|nr:CdaR family protein [Candidatus Binataceae bacterium]
MSNPARKSLPDVARDGFTRPLALRDRYLGRGLGTAIRRNTGLRVISLMMAIGLWLFVNAGERNAQQSFTVPISYRGLPPHFMIADPHPTSVSIEVSGPRTLLSLIQPNRLTLRLNLAGAGVGQMMFKIGPDSFNVLRKTTVVSVSPSQIVLDLDRMVMRSVPVRIVTSGTVADGYHVTSVDVNPRTATVKGPSKQIAQIAEVASEAIDLGGATGNLSREVPLEVPAGATRIDPPEAAVAITVSEVIADKEFRSVPVRVRNCGYTWKVQPEQINVTLRGPVLRLAQIDLTNAVAIDAGGMAPGIYAVPLQVELPEGVELVHQSADKVRLRVFRHPRSAPG